MKFKSPLPRGETKEQRRDRLSGERRLRANRWVLIFCWIPRRLWVEKGDFMVPTDTVAWLELAAVRSRDLDHMFPWIHGPAGFALTQPTKKGIR